MPNDLSPVNLIAQMMTLSKEESSLNLHGFIEGLLHQSPERLAWLLYRLDVDEQQLKQSISEQPQNEVDIITNKVFEKLNSIQMNNKKTSGETPDWSFDLED